MTKPDAIVMVTASGDEYSNEEEDIDEVTLDVSSIESEDSYSEPDMESSDASSQPPSCYCSSFISLTTTPRIRMIHSAKFESSSQ